MMDHNVALYGTNEAPARFTELKAGPVCATFDCGQLRWIRIGGVEVIRAIAFLVRDRNWSTPSTLVTNLDLKQDADSFILEFDARCPTIDGDFVWHGLFTGEADGTLTCTSRGHPEQDFLTGRTGFVILHPLKGTIGTTLTIEHTDGRVERTVMPEVIDPKQTFFDIRAMTHDPFPGLKATIRMEGDSWETEDHRNWTDASLKTYCRPLALPWPYEIAKGKEVRQSAKLTFEGQMPGTTKQPDGVRVRTGESQGVMPRIGLSILPEDAAEAARHGRLIAATGVTHLNCRLDLRNDHWKEAVAPYGAILAETGAEMVLELILAGAGDPKAELAVVAAELAGASLKPAAAVVTPPQDLVSYPPGKPFPEGIPTYEAIAAAARGAFPDARIGGGMLANFTELNRKRPPEGVFDFIVHATSAMVHAADDQSVMETLESIGHIIRSTRSFIGDAPYRIGPSHIGNSFNPYGSKVTPNPDNRRMTMARMDPRHRGLFGSAWTVGFLSQVADGGLEAATVASPVGEFGIVYTKQAHEQPWFDTVQPPPAVYPVFHVMSGIAKGAGKPQIAVRSVEPARVRALGWTDGTLSHIWIANLTAGSLKIDLDLPGLQNARMAVLDERTMEMAVRDPTFMDRLSPIPSGALDLESYGVAHIVFEKQP